MIVICASRTGSVTAICLTSTLNSIRIRLYRVAATNFFIKTETFDPDRPRSRSKVAVWHRHNLQQRQGLAYCLDRHWAASACRILYSVRQPPEQPLKRNITRPSAASSASNFRKSRKFPDACSPQYRPCVLSGRRILLHFHEFQRILHKECYVLPFVLQRGYNAFVYETYKNMDA